MTKFCVWRTHEKFTDGDDDQPSYSFATTHEEAEQAADKWRKRDRHEINSYASPHDHHIPVIKDRSYFVYSCDGEDCLCQQWADEHYNGDTSIMETPDNSWDDPDNPNELNEPEIPPRKRFLGIF